MAKGIPIYKMKGDTQNVDNYRPISLLPVLSKVIEKIVNKQVVSYINKHSLLYKKQFGFIKNSNTEMAIADMVDNILKNKDDNYNTLGIFLDIRKAFDSLKHNILLDKLHRYGFRGKIHDWFASYLNDRSQVTSVNGV